MSDYRFIDRSALVFVVVAGLLLVAAVFFIGRCSTRYTVKVQVQPTQEKESPNDAQ